MNIRRRLDALEILNPKPTRPTRLELTLSLQRKLGLPLPEHSSQEVFAEGFRRLKQLQKNFSDEAFAEFRVWALRQHK